MNKDALLDMLSYVVLTIYSSDNAKSGQVLGYSVDNGVTILSDYFSAILKHKDNTESFFNGQGVLNDVVNDFDYILVNDGRDNHTVCPYR